MIKLTDVVGATLFKTIGDLDASRYEKLSTDTTDIIFNVPYLTMTIIEEPDRWVFTVKMTIKDNTDFFETMRLNGFIFHDDIEQDFREKFSPIHQQKNLISEKFNLHVNYVIEHMFFFDKTNVLTETWSSCTHDIMGAYLFIRVQSDTDGQPLYSYFGYYNKNLITKTYKTLNDYEFCVIYLQQKFYEKGNYSVCDDITYDNFENYFELLKMVEI